MSQKSKDKLWGGRFAEATHELMERINASIWFDKKMFRQDIAGSKAHANSLAASKVISAEENRAIQSGLDQVLAEIEAGKMEWRESLEDIHTHVELRLKEIIGDAAGKLHTGRSRNDQVALDVRLWVMGACAEIEHLLVGYSRSLVELAAKHADVIMPGYTHMQRAQPVLLGHHLMAYYEMACRDRERLADCLKRTSVSPLGAAALAGTTFPLDPARAADELGLKGHFANSMDAVSDRDFAAEFIFVLSLIQIHLSRLSEELVYWSSQEFAFISLSDAFATGSSIMPQKKNPDAAELVRGKSGRVMGDLVSLLTTLKGLPLSYNKDMQEDKEPVFDAFETVRDCLAVLAPLLDGLTVNEKRMREAVSGGFLEATEVADYLAARGVPFRKAHEISGQAVRMAEERGITLPELSLEDYQKLSPVIEKDLYEVLKAENAVERRNSPGGTARANLDAALEKARERLWPEG